METCKTMFKGVRVSHGIGEYHLYPINKLEQLQQYLGKVFHPVVFQSPTAGVRPGILWLFVVPPASVVTIPIAHFILQNPNILF